MEIRDKVVRRSCVGVRREENGARGYTRAPWAAAGVRFLYGVIRAEQYYEETICLIQGTRQVM